MPDAPAPHAESDADTGSPTEPQSGGESLAGAPRWAKASGIIGLVLVVLVVVLLLAGGGNHGPGRHTSSGAAGGQATPSSSVGNPGAAAEHDRPPGGHTP
ncbi:MAG: hypothetical protein AVDCRST_MAG67-3538 [uncultured Solirubrobacteraceae bacterium]|uniref:Uncharacterized protein n=1 Tax=uncultured Solirubrobacteraceae bacterium TaxID=1162706 RepID=A0A6J4TKB9_9ACTN|nr:MAG: hypothetical protein AVDCRST_MAG67-3538 [uncultured Solirubrobacteraceae bacterium]